ncbi:MAG: DNA translocase FtsK [Turicibacter sp.]|nr:DNA translocase FtsK [Turicibacter sp.]
MAKKKRVSTKKTIMDTIYMEVVGLLCVLLAILMLGELGLIGEILMRVGLLLVGDFHWALAILSIMHGLKMMVTRKKPALWGSKQIGSYLVITAALVFAHIPVYRLFIVHQIPLLGGIWNYYWGGDVLYDGFQVGGGLLGAVVYAIFVPLITWIGLFGLNLIVMIYGILLMFGLSIQEVYETSKKRRELLKKTRASRPKNPRAKKEAPEFFKDGKKITPSLEQSLGELDAMGTDPMTAIPASIKPPAAKKEGTIKIRDFTERVAKEPEPEEAPQLAVVDFTAPSLSPDYLIPPATLLIDHPITDEDHRKRDNYAEAQMAKLEETFQSFQVRAKVQEVHIGPSVTRFEVLPEAGVKVSKIQNLSNEIAMNLAAKGIRIEAPIPGKSVVGIEVPNSRQTLVGFKEILKEVPPSKQKEKLLMVLGRDIAGSTIYSTLNSMPHLLVAGATGSGKSVCINTMLCSLLMRSTPQEVKMLLIDPKKVELNRYNGLPHLLAPVVTDPRLAAKALQKVVAEMEHRYDLFLQSNCRDIETYNQYIDLDNEAEEAARARLPFVVVIIDELADLMMVASKDVEDSIMRLTQMARAAGIHLVIATQRPSVDVITGVIKANVPSRIAFGVSSSVDSRTILDSVGAEKLVGKGDMLFLPMGASSPTRIQGAFISDAEVLRIVEFIKNQQQSEVKHDFLESIETQENTSDFMDDPLMRDVLAYIFETKKVSASLLQRRFKIGYNRAARLVDELQDKQLISPQDGNKAREVLLSEEQYQQFISAS